MKLIQLQYPDEAPLTKILDDLTVLSRNVGQKGLRPVVAFDHGDERLDSLATKLNQRQIANTDAGDGQLPDDQAIVEDGVPYAITGGEVQFTIAGNEITGGTFTPEGG